VRAAETTEATILPREEVVTGVAQPGKSKDKDTTPALYDHIKRTYDKMIQTAEVREVEEGGKIIEVVVWEGHLTHLITDLNLSTPYYTKVTRAMKEMGVARQLRRGGSTGLSQWELIKAPTEELLEKIGSGENLRKKRAQTRLEQMEEQLRQQNARILKLERALENIIEEETTS
jgi:hypothetical protein